MSTKVSLTEAAAFLGVSKATLRNWDSDGKLPAIRNPINGYRQYDFDDLIAIKQKVQGVNTVEKKHLTSDEVNVSGSKEVKQIVSKLHNIIRDNDANSNIVTRFDEISKLLFVRLMSGASVFKTVKNETASGYYERIQREYTEVIQRSGKAIPERFSRILLKGKALQSCGEELLNISIDEGQVDIKGLAYEDTIRGTFDKSDNQQYFTPYQIVDFMMDALSRFMEGTICDPACGTAGFLTKAPDDNTSCILGLEVDERLAWVSTLNLLLHEKNSFTIECLDNGGSLGEAARKYFGKVNVITTNPPFGSDYTDPDILNNFDLGRNRSSRRRGILFIEQAWNLLKEGGYVAIIIDQGVLNAATNSDVREFILSHFLVKGIIDLPESAFLPYANVSASILILEKQTVKVRQEKTFFAKSDNIGRKTNGDDDIVYSSIGKPKLNSDLPHILECWNCYLNGDYSKMQNGCFVADIEEYKEEDKSLRMDYMFHHPVRNESRELLNSSKSQLVSLAELCDERNQSYIPAADRIATTILFTGLANIESNTGVAVQELTPAASIKSSVKRYEPNDIIFSKMRPALRKVAVMNTDEGGYVSSECSVFTVRIDEKGEPLIDPEILSAILRSDFVFGQIMPYVTGIGRPRISGKDLRKIRIPLPDKALQKRVKENLFTNRECEKQLRDKAQALREEAEELSKRTLNDVAVMMAGGR